jgi:hypothetical protein
VLAALAPTDHHQQKNERGAIKAELGLRFILFARAAVRRGGVAEKLLCIGAGRSFYERVCVLRGLQSDAACTLYNMRSENPKRARGVTAI